MPTPTLSRLLPAAVSAMLAAGSVAAAQSTDQPPAEEQPSAPGTPVQATLKSGEILDGTIKERKKDGIVIEHPLLGPITIPESALQTLVATGEAPPPPPPPPRPGFFQAWSGGIDLGLAGSSGNTERLSLRAGINGKRNDTFLETSFDARYIYATEEGENTENK